MLNTKNKLLCYLLQGASHGVAALFVRVCVVQLGRKNIAGLAAPHNFIVPQHRKNKANQVGNETEKHLNSN